MHAGKLLATTLLCLSTQILNAQTMGLFLNETGSEDGYVLFSPIMSNNTYLIDKCGKEVHNWTSTKKPGQSVYLLPDGSLLRPANSNNTVFNAGGSGGIIERYDWNSALQWSYTISDTTQCQHHDICYLPNGNILAIVWEKKSTTEAIAMGRNPTLLGTSLWSEKVVELQPTGTGSATIVWEWHVWDHLNQDYANTLPGYDTISNHPELVNINYYSGMATNADWLHINSIAYNPALDQIMLSIHNFNELWIIDHSTTTAQAASHTGGTRNKGGDLLYRWGNAAAYNNGTVTDKKLYGQHNARWIENGLPDSGKIMVFNNGQGRPDGNYSTVNIIDPPIDLTGNYTYTAGMPYLPDSAMWTYKADTPTNFYGANISGAQRLKNGNTLICVGPSGIFFEIDASKHTVWKYINPVNSTGAMTQGATPTQNLAFRCTLYEGNYTGFTGHTLVAGSPIEINPIAYSCNTDIAGIKQNIPVSITALNPFYNSVVISTSQAIQHAQIVLRGIAGNTIAVWHNIDLAENKPVALPVSAQLSAGMYILSVRSQGYAVNIKLMKE